MKTKTKAQLKLLVAGILLSISGGVFAAKGGSGGPPVGGETLGNNLSVPAIFVPSTAGAPTLRIPCPTDAVTPTGPTSSVYVGYYLQKTEAIWSADCDTAATASVIADWGDNLTVSGATLAAGRPIRVEVGLLDTAALGLKGYGITNLTPDLEDRLATYGTLGEPDAYLTAASGTLATRVWDAGAHLKIENVGTGAVIFDGPMTAEINSGGAVVFGYNWGIKGKKSAPAPGTYTLTFTTSSATTITGVADTAGNIPGFTANSTFVTVTLSGSVGGGGGQGGKPN
jgi:hypothetical protein